MYTSWRCDFLLLDETNPYTTRFLGFSVYLSNTTNKEEGILCFKDRGYTKATIPNPTNITCINHGQYLIYYNNRTHSPLPVGYSSYAFSELCEIQVYGKYIFVYIILSFFFIKNAGACLLNSILYTSRLIMRALQIYIPETCRESVNLLWVS